MSSGSIDQQSRKVRYSEVGSQGTLKLVHLFNYLQDAADEHATKLGVSAIQLRERGYAWVLYRVRVTVHRYPMWDETIYIRTWPFLFNKLYEMRNFEVTDSENGKILSAATCWLMLDLKRGRPSRIDRTPFADIMKGCKPVDNNLHEIDDIDRIDSELVFSVRAHDLDSNRHVNNSIYPEWAVETVPPWFLSHGLEKELESLRPVAMEVNFLTAARYGDEVVCQTQHIDGARSHCFLHRIIRSHDGKVLARVRSSWDKTPK
ncbi:MAG: hypothetical protein JW971_01230 [Synergistales bacterium]|nr:hypothetical protein [Synergistales bacterium]